MNKLYYFTGTGNSLWTAKQLAAQLPDFEIEPVAGITSVNSQIETRECDAIGLVFPVYLYGPPLIAKRFSEKLKITKSQYVFYIAVHGGYPANTIHVVRKLIKKNNGHLDAGF